VGDGTGFDALEEVDMVEDSCRIKAKAGDAVRALATREGTIDKGQECRDWSRRRERRRVE